MKEHPILFSAPMVRAILDGSKSATRRIVKFPAVDGDDQNAEPERAWRDRSYEAKELGGCACLKMPYGPEGGDLSTVQRIFSKWEIGDRLWVKETHLPKESGIIYRADFDPVEAAGFGAMYGGWKPSIFCRREYSRITLEVTGVRVERLQEISEEDAIAEGVDFTPFFNDPADAYRTLWESINGPGSWDANPFVWVVEFKRIGGQP